MQALHERRLHNDELAFVTGELHSEAIPKSPRPPLSPSTLLKQEVAAKPGENVLRFAALRLARPRHDRQRRAWRHPQGHDQHARHQQRPGRQQQGLRGTSGASEAFRHRRDARHCQRHFRQARGHLQAPVQAGQQALLQRQARGPGFR